MVEQLTAPPVVPGRWYPMTFEEFVEWAPNEGKAEWVDGWGMVYVGSTTRHGRMVQFASELIGGFVRLFDLGEVFSQQTIMRVRTRPSGRMPDIMVVLKEHRDRVERLWIEGPADFAMEFPSENDAHVDFVEKRAEFEAEGLPEYVMVDGRERRFGFTWLKLGEDRKYDEITPDDEGRYHSTVLPGFWLDPRWFYQDPLPDPDEILFEIAPEAYLARAEERRRRRASLGGEN
jgi:Uma2 family endonuclease